MVSTRHKLDLESPLMTQREAAAYLHMSLHTFRRYVAAHLPQVRTGGRILRYRRRDLEQWITDHEIGGNQHS